MGNLQDREVAFSTSDRRLSWPSLDYVCLKPIHFISFTSITCTVSPSHSGSPLSEGEVHWRGCIDREMARMPESDEDENDKKFYSDEDDEEEDYHSCHSTRHYQDLVEEVFPTEVTDDAEDGGVCFCEDNRCNVQQSETVQEADDRKWSIKTLILLIVSGQLKPLSC